MKKIVALTGLALFVFGGLTGCGYGSMAVDESGDTVTHENAEDNVSNRTSNYPTVESFDYELPNGDKVHCIWAEGTRSGGLWCTGDYDVQR